jgi:hypothetical protein
MLPVYRELLAAEPRLAMLVFSGDVDGIVPVLGTRRWIRALELPIAAPWRPWTSATGAARSSPQQRARCARRRACYSELELSRGAAVP